jgi:MYXO-CTERM domain-containing protein
MTTATTAAGTGGNGGSVGEVPSTDGGCGACAVGRGSSTGGPWIGLGLLLALRRRRR